MTEQEMKLRSMELAVSLCAVPNSTHIVVLVAEQIYQWFLTGDIPTNEQLLDLIQIKLSN